jgi:hypothetical protein
MSVEEASLDAAERRFPLRILEELPRRFILRTDPPVPMLRSQLILRPVRPLFGGGKNQST